MRRVARLIVGLAAVSAAAVSLLAPSVVDAQTAPTLSVITVEGQASADLATDAADLVIGVEAERPSPATATAEVARAAQAVSDGLKADGIADKDMGTSAITLDPVYPDDTAGGSRSSRLPRAFRASTRFTLTIRPPERAGLIVAHAVDKGATGIDGLTFTSSDTAATLDRLRGEAMRDARRKADLYVGALGLRLGRALEITPQEDDRMRPPMMVRASRSILAAPTPSLPVAPGPLHLQTVVTVRFAIAD